MPTYRDLIFLAIDYGKQDIVVRLAETGPDLYRKEKVLANYYWWFGTIASMLNL